VSHAIQVLVSHGMGTHPPGSTWWCMRAKSALRDRALWEASWSSKVNCILMLVASEPSMTKCFPCYLIEQCNSCKQGKLRCQELSRKISHAMEVMMYIAIAEKLSHALQFLRGLAQMQRRHASEIADPRGPAQHRYI
jgi:hypothetical protein